MFGPLKKIYNSLCIEFMSESLQHTITKQTWPGIFKKAWTTAITSPNMISSFAATGIYPFNSNAISEEAFAPSVPSTESIAATSTTEQSSVTTVVAEIHAIPSEQPPVLNTDEQGYILEFPLISDNGQEILSLPVSFNNTEIVCSQDVPDLASGGPEKDLLLFDVTITVSVVSAASSTLK